LIYESLYPLDMHPGFWYRRRIQITPKVSIVTPLPASLCSGLGSITQRISSYIEVN